MPLNRNSDFVFCPQDAVHSFTAIDINKDGYLSLEEFVKLGREFFLTEDEHSPSKAFWGPLVNP